VECDSGGDNHNFLLNQWHKMRNADYTPKVTPQIDLVNKLTEIKPILSPLLTVQVPESD
jgi:hypothetical protein